MNLPVLQHQAHQRHECARQEQRSDGRYCASVREALGAREPACERALVGVKRRRESFETLFRPGQLRDQFLFKDLTPVLVLQERFKKPHMIDMTIHHSGVALVDVGEILNLIGIEVRQHFGNAKAVDSGVLEHAGGAEETVFHDGGAACAAILSGGRRPLHAPEATGFTAHRLTAVDAEAAGFPIDRLRAIARFTEGAHGWL